MFKCNCGREFEKQSSLNSHARFCKLYIKKDKSSKYKDILNNVYKCECGKEYGNYQSFNAHLSHCDYHHECIGTIRKLRPSEINHSMNWENKTKEEIKEIQKKSGKTYSERMKEGKVKNAWKGRKHTEESKQKTRESTIKYIESCCGKIRPRYSIKACKYIDKLNEDKGWNLQHAENGGEIICEGYRLDAYDKEQNIVIEYDEARHYIDVQNNILRLKDIERQNKIINKLNCKFYRYNSVTKKLYQIN